MKDNIIHYPSLRTILMIEDTIKRAELPLTRKQLKEALPKKVMHQTLNVALKYLEDHNIILDGGSKGIIWIFNPVLEQHPDFINAYEWKPKNNRKK